MTLDQAIYANDEKAADVTSVVVQFDYATNRAKELTADIRAMLESYLAIEKSI